MSSGPTPSGLEAAADLDRRFPDEDWKAAIAKGAVVNREEVERHFSSADPLPEALSRALDEVERHIRPPNPAAIAAAVGPGSASRDAPMEIDAEAGLTMLPGERPRPSATGSPHEMRQRQPGDEQGG